MAGASAPWPLLSFPASLVLLAWLPGRLLASALSGVAPQARASDWVAASLALMPVPLYVAWWFSAERWVIVCVVAAVNAALWLFARRRTTALAPPETESAGQRLALFGLLGFTALCVFGAYVAPLLAGGAQVHAAHDYVKHHSVLLSLERHALPLRNYFYATEFDTPYYYYLAHHALAAGLRKLGGDRVPIPVALGVTSAAVACTLLALVYQLARRVLGTAWPTVFAVACTALIGGWDVVPNLLRMLQGAAPVVVLDSWCPTPWRIHNLFTQFLWCPQHVVVVLTFLLAVRWLTLAPWARWWIAVAPLMAVSVFGSSVYLAMLLFPVAAAWALWRGLRSDGASRLVRLGGIALIAALGAAAMTPMAAGYAEMGERFGGGLTLDWPRFELAFVGRLLPPGPLANFADLPWLLLVDFGMAALACVLAAPTFWRRCWGEPALRMLLIAAPLGVLAMFTVRSSVSWSDYAFRLGVMPLQIVGALAAGALLAGEIRAWARRMRLPVLLAGVVLGLPAGLYEPPGMVARAFLLPSKLRSDTGALAYLRTTPPGTVVQGSPLSGRFGADREHLVELIERPMGVFDPENLHVRVFFPRDAGRWRRTHAEVESAFRTPSPEAAHSRLRRARVERVLVGSVERAHFGACEQFEDARYFAREYDDGAARVYAVR